MDKKQHLENLYQILRDTDQEYDFDKIYSLLQSEISNERYNKEKDNKYLQDLETTDREDADAYRVALMKKPKGKNYSLFSDFIRSFKNDIHDELMRILYK